jgi:hypothetical protein
VPIANVPSAFSVMVVSFISCLPGSRVRLIPDTARSLPDGVAIRTARLPDRLRAGYEAAYATPYPRSGREEFFGLGARNGYAGRHRISGFRRPRTRVRFARAVPEADSTATAELVGRPR